MGLIDLLPEPPAQELILGSYKENTSTTVNEEVKAIFHLLGRGGKEINPDKRIFTLGTGSGLNMIKYTFENLVVGRRYRFYIDVQMPAGAPSNTVVTIGFNAYDTQNQQWGIATSTFITPSNPRRIIEFSITNQEGGMLRAKDPSDWYAFHQVPLQSIMDRFIFFVKYARGVNNPGNDRYAKVNKFVMFNDSDSLYAPLEEITGVCLNQVDRQDNYLQTTYTGTNSLTSGLINISPGLCVIRNHYIDVEESTVLDYLNPLHYHEYMLNGTTVTTPVLNDYVYVVARYNPVAYADNVQGMVLGLCKPRLFDTLDNPEAQGWCLLNALRLNSDSVTISEFHTYNNRLNFRPTLPRKGDAQLNGGVINPGGQWSENWL